MSMVTAFNPSVPATFDLRGMFLGKVVYIYGVAKPDAVRFDINLMCGPNGGDDIALHFNPRFSEEQVVRNTRKGGWGPEERSGGFPFQQGKPFAITMVCESDEFEIYVNRYKMFATYKHRMPLSSITHLNIGGNCDVKMAATWIRGLEVDIPVQTLRNPGSVPLILEVPFHNIREHSIVVVGKPTSANGRFHVNFENENGRKIHFHFNPRMNEKQIVRNTLGDSWMAEERDLAMPFPFQLDVPFQLKFIVKKRKFVVELNGASLLTFGKRLKSMKNIRRIGIAGNVDLDLVEFY